MAGKVRTDDIPIAPKKKVIRAQTKTGRPEARKGCRTHKGPHVKSIIIPTCWEEASAADRMLVTMRGDGADWGKIRALWKNITGQDTAASTLPNRYTRVKANLMRLEDGDVSLSFYTFIWMYFYPRASHEELTERLCRLNDWETPRNKSKISSEWRNFILLLRRLKRLVVRNIPLRLLQRR